MLERLRVRFDECSEKVSRADELDNGRLTDDTLTIVQSPYTIIVLYTDVLNYGADVCDVSRIMLNIPKLL